ncbi:ferredoxin reductase family protein [Naasia lichenicola]|uniref:Ferric reductase n=1 Tax=Naasia lichenicola TaxID=2565933 RepID=A0A4S4FNR8_9MICO|nr:ferredoxin reductase family protein [Naasia lichenicola]THG30641.1 ferric reductase [Naasia lichenicola]THG31878.1 ferric reductase [Naasia lichenicola]
MSAFDGRSAVRDGRSAAASARPGRRMSPGALLTLIGTGAATAAALGFIGAPTPMRLDIPLIAHLAGLLAGYGVVVMVALMSRVPALERGVGADRMARWHGWGGRLVIALILIHGIAATIGWMQLRGLDALSAMVEVIGLPWIGAATVASVMLLGIGYASMRAARRKLGYENWHLIHLATYVAIGLSFPHELAGPDLAGIPVFQVFWSLLYTISFGLLLRYRVLEPLLQFLRHRMRVERVVTEADGVTSIVIRGRHLPELQAESGQFFRWRFLTRTGWRAANPFSLSAPPSEHHLRLTVKAVGESTRAIQTMKVGTRVFAEGPYGAMTEHRRTGSGVLLIAGGVGITPMRALFESLDIDGDQLTLLYRASNEAEIIFRDELEEIAIHRGAHLIYVLGPSADPANAMSGRNLAGWVPDLADRDVYMCASPRFSEAARAGLREAGVSASRVHQEEFAF